MKLDDSYIFYIYWLNIFFSYEIFDIFLNVYKQKCFDTWKKKKFWNPFQTLLNINMHAEPISYNLTIDYPQLYLPRGIQPGSLARYSFIAQIKTHGTWFMIGIKMSGWNQLQFQHALLLALILMNNRKRIQKKCFLYLCHNI